ncbi:7-deoxyloganetin glucosyltransferase [Arachis hypogaea]|uniref:7-deoxyloganetin glucosyltransferase n=1 Tax=Arachis hypogaea TaxID=3818 RepID=UPI000DECDF2F|nr:7-deoxyloganetin glucosyltransferase [Arachis hypogaea]
MFNYNIVKVNTAMHAKGIILNTFEDLESEVLDAIRAKYSNVYSIGPLSMLFKQLSNSNTQLELIDLNLWKEDNKCLEWLDKRDRGSVVYVIRPNLVHDNNNNGDGKLSDEYVNVIERCERGLVLGWCQQEKVLCHASIGGFLTHCGWNSTLESICEGVPMACWPFFAEQQTNSFCACKKWGIGIEIECDVKREQVEGLVRELMEGQKGKEIKVYKLEGLI